MDLISLFNLLLLGIGFGFVIFWHELGHFLAAKWAGVRVEQFAVGFGNAIFSFRKGLGIRRGTSAPEYQRRLEADPNVAMSPTEYRLNWLPLGGYVKMLGQEDLAVVDKQHEPDSYQAKSVGKRMIIISAGVVMNVILAAVLFTVVYFWGFSAEAAKVGQVLPGTPAAQINLQPGDTIISVNGRAAHDFAKLRLGIALADPDEETSLVVQPNGSTELETRTLKPEVGEEGAGMLTIGVLPMPTLDLRNAPGETSELENLRKTTAADVLAVLPGERVLSVDNMEVDADDFPVYAAAFDRAGDEGRAVILQKEEAGGTKRVEKVMPTVLMLSDAYQPFAGVQPLLKAQSVPADSKMQPGDIFLALKVPDTGDTLRRPTMKTLGEWLAKAGERGQAVSLTVDRGGEVIELEDVPLRVVSGGLVSRLMGSARYGLGVLMTQDLQSSRVAAEAVKDSAAASMDGLVAEAADVQITAVNGQAVANYYDFSRLLRTAIEGADEEATVPVTLFVDGEVKESALVLNDKAMAAINGVDWMGPVATLSPFGGVPVEAVRRTRNPLTAMGWGVLETRDQIANLYLTLRRVTVDQTVSASNLSGPVGIIHFGTIVAAKGYDWLLWFLAMLSANLAVVNFLPIPILDGGHMVFLLWEKIRGKAPPRAVQEGALWVGLAALGCFVIFVTINDIGRLIPF